ncbi:hypothetical protein [Mucilaginibacter antarcticus]|uniref:GLPGLI family protein n=1 Tax=Mucilaginibacter antarcticus TaxID=1855725 RepID=A0ABW5XKX6_9SPHI
MKKSLFFTLMLAMFAIRSANAQTKNVAVVSFFINKQIDVTDFGEVAYLAVTKLNEDPAFNLTPMLNDFHTRFFDDYSKSLPFAVLPEEKVLKNEAYKAFVPVGNATSGILNTANFLTAVDGYKILLHYVGSPNEENMAKMFSEADGIMTVSIHFKLIKIGFGGMGVVKVSAVSTLALYNKNGDKVFSIKQDAKSKNMAPLVGGVPVMTPEKIMPMCESAIDELKAALQKDMRKIIKKSDAKL